jgi:RNA polymerase sigma-70 factor (ECF subfamily)
VDRELVIRAGEGDHDAFARLAASSIGRLNAIARLILSDPSAAEDAVQDALIEAWRDLRGLRNPDSFDAWLNRLLVRSCQDARRKARRRWSIELPAEFDRPDGADIQASIEIADYLDRGLHRLTVDQRAVLVLSFYLDMSQADAAAALGIPIGTLKSRISRALDALRAAIAADERRSLNRAERPA